MAANKKIGSEGRGDGKGGNGGGGGQGGNEGRRWGGRNRAVRREKPRVLAAFTVVAWGILAHCQAAGNPRPIINSRRGIRTFVTSTVRRKNKINEGREGRAYKCFPFIIYREGEREGGPGVLEVLFDFFLSVINCFISIACDL